MSSSPSSSSRPASPQPQTQVDPSTLASSSTTAPFRSFPRTAFASVEYPGPVSHPSALLRVCAQDEINECFNALVSDPKFLEMRYGGDDRNGVPVRGLRVPSQKLLLKVVRRKRTEESKEKGKQKDMEGTEKGVFRSEVVGPITQTVRFRCEYM